jgi:hypothetical protein
MRQRVDPGDREAEVGVELVGDPQGVSLQAESEEVAVAVERGDGLLDLEGRQIVIRQSDAAKPLGTNADQPDTPAVRVTSASRSTTRRLTS